MSRPLASIVLPVHNQADQIRDIVQEYESVLARIEYPHELILVVNGSRDGSDQVCAALADDFESVRSIVSERAGWGRAVRLGLRAADGDILCYTNCARTTPDDLCLLLLYGMTHPDVVIKANRKIRENWKRRLGSLLYNLESRSLFDLPIWDVNGTPKVFPRHLDRLLDLTQDDDLIDLEFNVICRRQGYRILEVPLFSTRRHGGRSTTNLRSAIRMYVGAYRLSRRLARTAA